MTTSRVQPLIRNYGGQETDYDNLQQSIKRGDLQQSPKVKARAKLPTDYFVTPDYGQPPVETLSAHPPGYVSVGEREVLARGDTPLRMHQSAASGE